MTYWPVTCATAWTEEERAKGVYVAKRAIARGCDALHAVTTYMGMTAKDAEICVRRAEQEMRGQTRRSPAGSRRLMFNGDMNQ
jgi:hypothetical protein